MWRPDRSLLRGPDRPTARDIDPLNRVFAESFTDRYSRDGLVGVRVPQLNPLVWRYAIEDAGDGAMIWRDGDGHMVAFNMVHRSGTEGWMGPLAVRPDRQAHGLGSTMVRTGIEWLRSQGATTIGLETMPRTLSRSLRVVVARGSMAYSAVIQPSPEPLRQRGTPSVTLAVHSTRVWPNSTSTDPSGCMVQLRVMATGRSRSGVRSSGRDIPPPY